MAGLACYYNTNHYYYLYVTRNNDTKKKELALLKCDKGQATFYPAIELEENREIVLMADINRDLVQFAFRYADAGEIMPVEKPQNINILTDEYTGGFTGTFIAIACQDLENYTHCAHFGWLEIEQ